MLALTADSMLKNVPDSAVIEQRWGLMCVFHTNKGVIKVFPGGSVHCCSICPDTQIWVEDYRRQAPAESPYFIPAAAIAGQLVCTMAPV